MPFDPDTDVVDADDRYHAIPEFVMTTRLESGIWRARVGLYSFAHRKTWANGKNPKVWPSRAKLADRIGEPRSTLHKQLSKLASLGWIRRSEDGLIELAREEPFEVTTQVEFVWTDPEQPRATGETAATCSVDGHGSLPTRNTGRPFSGSTEESSGSADGPGGGPPRKRTGSVHGPQTDQEQEAEQSKEQEPPRERDLATSTQPPCEIEVEREVLALVIEHGFAGLAPGPTYVRPAVQAVVEGRCTVEQVGMICAEYKRRRDLGDRQQGAWPQLFFDGKAWYRTQRQYLGIQPAQRIGGKRGASAALSGTDGYWDRRTHENRVAAANADPESPQTDDDEQPLNWQGRRAAERRARC